MKLEKSDNEQDGLRWRIKVGAGPIEIVIKVQADEPTAKAVATSIEALDKLMGAMERYAKSVSKELGFGVELTDEVMAEAQRRLDAANARLVADAITQRKKNEN